jgi:acetyl esterase/lipase
MKARYNIDPDRVYVSGVSGGGRIASMLGVGYADIFKGGFYIIGCNFYRQELSVEQKGAAFPKSYSVPPAKIFNFARKQSKHVFLTGDHDPNREQTEIYYKAFKKDGFEHITYLQVPGMGHRPPDSEWFEKGMAALDEKLPAVSAKPVTKVQKPTTMPAAASSTQPADPNAVADHLLSTARLYIDNKQYEIGRKKLAWIVEQYPRTPAAAEAKKLLGELAGK